MSVAEAPCETIGGENEKPDDETNAQIESHKDNSFTICDSPGIGDTRGPEIDIANTYGLVKAA